MDANAFVLKKRLDRSKEIITLTPAINADWLRTQLDAIQKAMFEKAQAFRDANIRTAATYDELKKLVAETPGFVRCHFTPSREIEAKIKEETKATVRCIPFDYNGDQATPGKDIYTGQRDQHPGTLCPVILERRIWPPAGVAAEKGICCKLFSVSRFSAIWPGRP